MNTILIIDDHQINLLLLSKVLAKLPNTLVSTELHAPTALQACSDKHWDLIVVDYMMPELNGLAFIRALRQLPGHTQTPVLMVTASTEPEVKYQLLDLGVVDFLTKPTDPSELTARARNLISLYRATKALEQHNASLRKGVQEMTIELAEREQESLLVLARAAESRDPQTGHHLARMSAYSRLIAQGLGLDEDTVEHIFLAAPVHDVGKIGIPDRILLNQGRLDPEEWVEMKRHAQYGYDILSKSKTPILQLGALIALNHHEAWDGSGYPNGLAGEAIPLAARIVTVADIFDALTSKRPYKPEWPLEEAIRELKTLAGKRLDARCVDAFLAQMDLVKEVKNAHDNP
jgi:putative two-component system response regulator